MAGDWLKMECCLPEKPEVFQIAGIMGMDPDEVFGKLFKVWRWFDAHTESGNAASVTFALVDRVCGVTGFGEAMAFVGWLAQDGRNLTIPNFDRHNGKTAKDRGLTAKRVAKSKVKSNGASVSEALPDALPREEKRREEKKEQEQGATAPADMFPGVPPEVARDFVKLRAAKKAPVTKTALAGIEREAGKAGMTLAQALQTCCERGWTGFKAEWMTGTAANEPARRLKELA